MSHSKKSSIIYTVTALVLLALATGPYGSAAYYQSYLKTLALRTKEPTGGRNIRPLACQEKRTGQRGVCMFVWECNQANGTHLDYCMDRFYVGTCCHVGNENEHSNEIDDHKRPYGPQSGLTTRRPLFPRPTVSSSIQTSSYYQTTRRPTTTSTTTTTTTNSPPVAVSTSPILPPSWYENGTIADSDFFSDNGTLLINDYKMICGRQFMPTSRVVGGQGSTYGEWPWQISVRAWRETEGTFLHACGASLLNANWAITAAHCIERIPLEEIILRIGDYDLSEEIGPFSFVERKIQLVVPHPKFSGIRKSFEYDMALLRLYEPVIFQPNIVPICVPEDDETFLGKLGVATGWGRLSPKGPIPAQLHEVQLPIISNRDCEIMFRTAGLHEHIPHIFMCAAWPHGGKDSCEGDSGGPFAIQREEDNRWVLGGIVSWGHGCGVQNQPGVYTRVSEFRNWINLILQF